MRVSTRRRLLVESTLVSGSVALAERPLLCVDWTRKDALRNKLPGRACSNLVIPPSCPTVFDVRPCWLVEGVDNKKKLRPF